MVDDVKTVTVEKLPECDICKALAEENPEPAEYDAQTKQDVVTKRGAIVARRGTWGYMCQSHFNRFGVGLGTGMGQKLVLPANQPDERIAQADAICKRCGLNCDETSWNRETGRFRLIGEEAKITVMVSMGLYCEEVG